MVTTPFRAVLLSAVLLSASGARGAPVRIPFASSLVADGAAPKFGRPGAALYFDIDANRMAAAPAGAPRFVRAARKAWGSDRGILLECGTENLLSDSSFEDDGGAWSLPAKAARRAGAGIHGGFGLAVTGPATVAHEALVLKVPPAFNSYCVSLYARRTDGGAMSGNEIECVVRSDGGETRGGRAGFERMGDGPWHRFSRRSVAVSGVEGTRHTVAFRFGAGEYVVDCAQLEWEWARSGGPSSYTAGRRAGEELSCDARSLFPGGAWSYSFWTYAHPMTSPNGHFFSIRNKASGVLVGTARGETAAGGKRALADATAPGGWVFVTVTYDGKRMDVYQNGVSNHVLGGPFEAALAREDFHRVYWATGYAVPMGLVADFTAWDRALAPEEVAALYRTGDPAAAAPAAKAGGGVPVRFATAKAGNVSVNIFDAGGTLVHQLAVGKKLPAGDHTLAWDGCDDAGKPVAPGRYSFKGLVSNVRSIWDGKVGNTSPSPGREELQYRTGHYSDVIAMPDGGFVTCSFWGEHSRVIQYVEGKGDHTVRWSSSYNSPWPAFCTAGAADGEHLYTVFSRFSGKSQHAILVKWSLKDGTRTKDPEVALEKPHERAPSARFPGYADDPRDPMPYGVCGLACRGGKLYVPFRLENRIAVYDAATMKETLSFACPSPRRVAVDGKGNVFATNEHDVLRFGPDGADMVRLVSGLDSAWGIAVGGDGKVYVTDAGDSHQVKVFDARGRPVRTFGRKGGHRGGRVSPDLLDMPLAVSVNTGGDVFVADFGGSRVLALGPDFSPRKTVHGRMPQTALSVSALDRSLVYTTFARTDFWEYKVDYTRKTHELFRRWNFTRGDPKGMKGVGNGTIHFRVWGGRLFGVQPSATIGSYPVVFEMVGDRVLPRVAMGRRRSPRAKTGFEKDWVWRDRNMDGLMQDEEYEFGDWPTAYSWHDAWVDANGDMYIANGYRQAGNPFGILKVPFEGLDANGLPRYTWASARWVVALGDADKDTGIDGKLYDVVLSTCIKDAAGNIYTSDMGEHFQFPAKNESIMKYGPDGRRLWKVGRRRRGRIEQPGDIEYCGCASGLVDDRYLFYVSYEGRMNCWDTDGLWVGRLFADLPEELKNEGECFNGIAFRHPNGKVYAYAAPDCTYRISRIVVEGLEDIERFAGAVDLENAAPPRAAADEGPAPWSILRAKGPVDADGEIGVHEWGTNTDSQAPVRFEYNGREVARSWAQWDDDALHVAWDIADDTPAVNKSSGDLRWAGDQVELMVRAEPGVTTASANARFSATEYLLEVGTDGDNRTDAYVILNGGGKKGAFLPGAKVALKVKADKTGYTMEATIPWSSLGAYRPRKGDRILWNMKIHWGTPDGASVAYMTQWSPGRHVEPQRWGTAVFE